MIAPIDIDCPTCKVTSGRYCVAIDAFSLKPLHGCQLDIHHATRIDAAFRRSAAEMERIIAALVPHP